MTAALDEARATVSNLEGRIERGDATTAQVTRYEMARSLLRGSEGKGLDAGEVARATEGGAGRTPTDNRDLHQAGETVESRDVRTLLVAGENMRTVIDLFRRGNH